MGGLRAAGGALKALTVLATAVAVVVVGIPGVGEASTTTTLDDVGPWTSASAVSYTASWLTSKGSGKYGGSDHYSNTAGAAATISVSGTAIRVYGALASWHGKAAFSVDGGAETIVDLYSRSRSEQRLLFQATALSPATHTIRERVTGLANPSATGTVITLDRIDVDSVPPAGGPIVTGWTPKPGVQWQWQLSSTPTTAELATAYAAGARAFDIDGDDASAADVAAIHSLGAGVGAVCYIDVGGWEDYRSDAANFAASVKGKAIDGWPSEKWLDVRQIAVLKPLMQARVQMCARKGFDAVEPDLLDGYENDTGFPITAAQQITYNRMIADLAHASGLTVAQKGDVDQSAELQPYFDWTLNEQCGQYNECGPLSAYTAAGKAVWIVEYSGFPKVCALDYPVAGASAMYKSLSLTASPRTPCRSSTG